VTLSLGVNHPAFTLLDQTTTSTTFGKISTTYTGPRVLQFAMYYRF
jgi:hypothetical protein